MHCYVWLTDLAKFYYLYFLKAVNTPDLLTEPTSTFFLTEIDEKPGNTVQQLVFNKFFEEFILSSNRLFDHIPLTAFCISEYYATERDTKCNKWYTFELFAHRSILSRWVAWPLWLLFGWPRQWTAFFLCPRYKIYYALVSTLCCLFLLGVRRLPCTFCGFKVLLWLRFFCFIFYFLSKSISLFQSINLFCFRLYFLTNLNWNEWFFFIYINWFTVII